MKIGIIGGGNMGSAIAQGLYESNTVEAKDIYICDRNESTLDMLKKKRHDINVSTDSSVLAKNADIIILAVKPWLVKEILTGIASKINFSKQIIISIAAGITLEELQSYVIDYSPNPVIFRLIPNTAIAVRQSMTFISHLNAGTDQVATVKNIFDSLGQAMVIEERLMPGATAICSCGLAYAMRYIRAATEGGVELGFYADQAKNMIIQTLRGAIELLESTGNNPETEIDKVTTPGGITIKGLNAMEAHGFTTSVIEGLKASVK